MKYIYSHIIAAFLILIMTINTSAQTMYGTTMEGGAYNFGVLYKYTPTPNLTTVMNFGNFLGGQKSQSPPERPDGMLLRGADGLLYGTSAWGGDFGSGTLWSFDPITDSLKVIHSFDWNDGSEPSGGVIQLPNGNIYGTTMMGGVFYGGVIFRYNPTTLAFDTVFQFNSQTTGSINVAQMTYHSNGKIYGTTLDGGIPYHGVLYEFDPTTNIATGKFEFTDSSGFTTYGPLCEGTNGKLYGMAANSGRYSMGTLYEYDPVADTLIVLEHFKGALNGSQPNGGPMLYNGKLFGTARTGGLNNKGIIYSYDIATTTFTKLMDFDSTVTGSFPEGVLSKGSDGWLYGSTNGGGSLKYGILFKFRPSDNSFIKLMEFDSISGLRPNVGEFAETSTLQFYASDTVKTSPPFVIQFTNKSMNKSNYIWKWQFGDGAISYQASPSHTYTNNGLYNVTLIGFDTVTNITDTLLKQTYLDLSGATPCPVVAAVNPSGLINVCPGDSVALFSTNNDPTYTYQWLRTGLTLQGATDTVFYAKQTGYYQVQVNNGSCWNFSNVAFVNQYPTVLPQIEEYGYISPCSNDSMELLAVKNYSSYLWSTGDTTQSIWVKESGFYTVTIGDNNGCPVTSSIDTVNTAMVGAPKICIVGVDSATGHNIIVWDQSSDIRIDSFAVYREGTINNQFQLIGTKARAESCVLIDYNSDPRVTSYRYRLKAIDSCYNETPVGPYHRTIHLTVNVGQAGAWNLYWNPYEGAEIATYHIYRGSDSAQMIHLASIPSTSHSYTDLIPPTGDMFYLLKVDLPKACSPGGGLSYTLSNSNFFNTRDAVVGLDEIQIDDLSVLIYPNPNTGQFTLKINSSVQQKVSLMIFSNIGSLIQSDQLNIQGNTTKNFDFSNLSKGLYYIRLQTKDNVIVRKVIIQ